ncbi:MAG: class I SAM-dependent methyltransferase [Thermomicrobiales bacterium]
MSDRTPRDDGGTALAERYSATAVDYARLWSPVIRPMGQRLIRAMPLATADRILDVGTGVGALVPDIQTAAPGALVIGVDGALGMLKVAQASVTIPLAAMDAGRLGFRSDSFDAAVLAFVLFHLPDPVQGLVEIGRVLRPGGVLGVATWGPPASFGASDVWDDVLTAFGAQADPVASNDRDELMDTPNKLVELLTAAAFDVVKCWNERFEHRWTLDALMAQRVAFGSYQRRIETLGPATRDACLARVREQLASLPADDLVFRPDIVFAIGQCQGNSVQTRSHRVAASPKRSAPRE